MPAFGDVLNGVMTAFWGQSQLSPGVLLRGFLLIAIFVFILPKIGKYNKKLFVWSMLVICSTVPAIVISILYSDQFFYDTLNLAKAWFMPLYIAMLVLVITKYRVSTDYILRALEVWAYIIALGFVVPEVLGIGIRTYGDYAQGSKGFFVAGNDASLALCISLFVIGYRLFFVQLSLFRVLMFLLAIYAVVQVGSRASLLLTAAVGVMLATGMVLLPRPGKQGILNSPVIRYMFGFLLIAITAGAVYFGLEQQNSSAYQSAKIEAILSGEHPRASLIAVASAYLDERPAWTLLTGEGWYLYEIGVGKYWPFSARKIAEVDWIDAFGAYGICYMILVYGFMLSVFWISLLNVFANRSGLSFMLSGAVAAYGLHSFVAGHAIFAPTPTTVFGVCAALILCEKPSKNRYANKLINSG